jgi:hypothetical protein
MKINIFEVNIILNLSAGNLSAPYNSAVIHYTSVPIYRYLYFLSGVDSRMKQAHRTDTYPYEVCLRIRSIIEVTSVLQRNFIPGFIHHVVLLSLHPSFHKKRALLLFILITSTDEQK